jgi:hypothetical protein
VFYFKISVHIQDKKISKIKGLACFLLLENNVPTLRHLAV